MVRPRSAVVMRVVAWCVASAAARLRNLARYGYERSARFVK